MRTRVECVAVMLLVFGFAVAQAADIEGTIVIKRKLTKRNVTAAASLYQRGVAVELGLDREEDPLSFERARVVIYLEGQHTSKPVTATIEQKNRRFIPDMLIVPIWSTVSFPNLDPIFHNVFSLSKPSRFDLGNYPKDHTRTVEFSKPGIVFVGCHLHPNMGAVVVVSPNQWCTRADAAGRFTLRDTPPGRYTIVAWHKAAGFFRDSIRIPANGTAHVQFIIPLDETGALTSVAHR
jgi:plastocyanin